MPTGPADVTTGGGLGQGNERERHSLSPLS